MPSTYATRYRDFLFNQGLDEPAQANIQDINPASDDVKIPVVYGLRRITPPLIFAAQSSINTEFKIFVYALSEGPCLGIYRLFMNKEYIKTDINMVLDNDGSPNGNANTVAVPIGGTFAGVAQFEFMSGREAIANNSSKLIQMHIPFDQRPTYDDELCYLVCAFQDYADNSGPYEDIPVVVVDLFGKQTAPAGNPASTTKIWTNNPADHIADYLTNSRYGAGFSTSRINQYYFAKAKTYFDSNIDNFEASGKLTIGKKYTSNIVLDTNKTVQENVSSILSQYFCLMPYVSGQFRLIPERDAGFEVDVDENSIVESITFTYPDSSTKYNSVNAFYQDPQKEFSNIKVTYPATQAAIDALVTEDGGFPNKLELNLNGVTDPFVATRIARTYLERSRKQIKFEFTVFKNFFAYTVGDVIRIKTDIPNTGFLTARISRMFFTDRDLLKVEAYTHLNAFYPPFSDLTANLPDYKGPLISTTGGYIINNEPTNPISTQPPSSVSPTNPGSTNTQPSDDTGAISIVNGSTTRSANSKGLIIVGDVKIDTAESKFNNASLNIGANSYVEIDMSVVTGADDSLWDFGTNEFTIDIWVYYESTANAQNTLLAKWDPDDTTIGWRLWYDNNGEVAFQWGNTVTNFTVGGTASDQMTVNSWNHLAVVSDSTSLRLYVNGTRTDQRIGQNQLRDINVPLRIATNSNETNFFTGFLDEIRISDSARYTGANLSVPTTVFTHDSNTLLLMHFSEVTGVDITANPSQGEAGFPGTPAQDPGNVTITQPTLTNPTPPIPDPPAVPSVPTYIVNIPTGMQTIGPNNEYIVGAVKLSGSTYVKDNRWEGTTQDARVRFMQIADRGVGTPLLGYQIGLALTHRNLLQGDVGYVYELPFATVGSPYGFSRTQNQGMGEWYYWDPENPTANAEKNSLQNGDYVKETVNFDQLIRFSYVPRLRSFGGTPSLVQPSNTEGINFFPTGGDLGRNSKVGYGNIQWQYPIIGTLNTNLTDFYPSGIPINVKFFHYDTKKYIGSYSFKIAHTEMTLFYINESRSVWRTRSSVTPPF